MEHVIKSFEWQWDKPKCILWFHAIFTDGFKASVGLPLAHVVATFDQCAAEVGLCYPPLVGDVDSVDGLFSSIKRAVKKVGNVAKSAVKLTVKSVTQTAKIGAKVVRSKYTGYLLAAVAVAFPAIGGPALAAQQAAKRAMDMYEDAQRAKRALQAGAKQTTAIVKSISRGQNVQQSIRQLAANNTPLGRMAVAALQSHQVH